MVRRLKLSKSVYHMKRTKTFTRAELAERWKCSEKTIRRAELRHGLEPAAFVGNQPVYTLPDVTAAERRILEHKRRSVGRRAVERPEMPAKGSTGLLSLKQIRTAAKKGGSR